MKSVKLHNLKPNEGSRKEKYRAARGMAQGRGKQAGKGQSGQNKRGGVRPGFEGGQNPWFRRLPKRGFNNINHVKYQVVNLSTLEKNFKVDEKVNFETLTKKGIINEDGPVKILANGSLKKSLNINVDAASATAKKAIEKAGGKILLTNEKNK